MWELIQSDLRQLSAMVAEMREMAKSYASADATYRRVKALAILDERNRGTAATIARDVIYSRQDVFDALMERDSAEVVYEAQKEGINALKLEIRVMEAQMQREWSQSGQR